MNTLRGKDIISAAQFTRKEIDELMILASNLRGSVSSPVRSLDLAKGKILATLFFEPSTRTRLSFETAMLRLGGQVIGFSSAESTSVAKGETFADTIRTVDQYADLIALRHPRIGSAAEAAALALAPVLNAGDGAGQHPTQALLDLFTLRQELGGIDGKTIALVGDLKHGRTIHSGLELYKHYACHLVLISPPQLELPTELVRTLHDHGVRLTTVTDLEMGLALSDAVYMTRIQKERFADPAEYEHLKDSYVLDRAMIERIKPDITIMHPLPRLNEISPDVDDLPGAAYFRQARNGVYVRMALLAMVLGKS